MAKKPSIPFSEEELNKAIFWAFVRLVVFVALKWFLIAGVAEGLRRLAEDKGKK